MWKHSVPCGVNSKYQCKGCHLFLWYLRLDSSTAGRYWASQLLAGKNSASKCPRNTSLNPTYRSVYILKLDYDIIPNILLRLTHNEILYLVCCPTKEIRHSMWIPQQGCNCITEVIIWKGCWSLQERVSTEGAMLSGWANRYLSSPQVVAGRYLPFSTCPICFLLPGKVHLC